MLVARTVQPAQTRAGNICPTLPPMAMPPMPTALQMVSTSFWSVSCLCSVVMHGRWLSLHGHRRISVPAASAWSKHSCSLSCSSCCVSARHQSALSNVHFGGAGQTEAASRQQAVPKATFARSLTRFMRTLDPDAALSLSPAAVRVRHADCLAEPPCPCAASWLADVLQRAAFSSSCSSSVSLTAEACVCCWPPAEVLANLR